MSPRNARVLLRFGFGATAGIVAGPLTFGLSVLNPTRPEVQCVTVGLLLAGTLALIRGGQARFAVLLAIAYVVARMGLVRSLGWGAALHSVLSAALVATGVLLVALIYDLLAARGWRIGKFLLTGPLLAGFYFALTPIIDATRLNAADPFAALAWNMLLGLVIGDGVGLGVEVTELFIDADHEPRPREEPDEDRLLSVNMIGDERPPARAPGPDS